MFSFGISLNLEDWEFFFFYQVLQPKLVALHSGFATTEGGLYGLCGQNGLSLVNSINTFISCISLLFGSLYHFLHCLRITGSRIS